MRYIQLLKYANMQKGRCSWIIALLYSYYNWKYAICYNIILEVICVTQLEIGKLGKKEN